MQYRYVPNLDTSRYATNLQLVSESKRLDWNNAPGQSVLLVETPFGKSPLGRMAEEICPALGGKTLARDRWVEVLSDVWVRTMTAADKARNNGCPLRSEASTYTVLATAPGDDPDTCDVLAPKEQAMNSPSCDVPLRIRAGIVRELRVEGRLRKHEVDTGFWRLSFDRGVASTYVDGDLSYRVGDLEVPIVRDVIANGFAFVRSSIKPELISNNPGLEFA